MLAVLHDQILLSSQGETEITGTDQPLAWNLGTIFSFCERYGITRLWISKGSGFWKRINRVHSEREDGFRVNPDSDIYGVYLDAPGWEVRPVRSWSNSITAWNERRFKVQVNIPGLTREQWSFDNVEDPYLLYNALEFFENKVGSPAEFPQKTSRQIFADSITRKPSLAPDDPDTYWQPFIEKMESEFIWTRKAGKDEKAAPFAHAFDKRSMFLSAARAVEVGFGPYTAIGECVYDASAWRKTVGLVELVEAPKFASGMFPEYAKLLANLFQGQTLFYTPYLPIISEFASIKIKRGWVWTEPVRLFEKYATRIGTAIKDTRDAPEDFPEWRICNQAFKSLYTVFFGWLGRLDRRTGFGAELFRPDWRGLIVSMAGANLLRNVRKVYEYTHKIPFAIYHDALMYFGENEIPALDFGKAEVMDLTKFTHEWTLPGKTVRRLLKENANAGAIDSAGKTEGLGK